MLPVTKKIKLPELVFPKQWQTVIFLNYGYVSVDKIAAVLACDKEIVKKEAERLGLRNVVYGGIWETKGYITLIRNNWYLLPYSQLLTLLGITEAKLDYILQNDDFLCVKLGGFKPECKEAIYSPLSEKEKEKTRVIADTVRRYREQKAAMPFEFFHDKPILKRRNVSSGGRIVHGYLSPCGDAFSVDGETYLPDALLAEYARQGVNGIWLHGVLSALSPYPFDETLCVGFEQRRAEMKKLISRCEGYGIKLYLYFNEPRALPASKAGKYANLIGRRENGYAALCFEREEVRNYLYEAVKDLLSDVKDLGGIITITMSENMTHCNYRPRTNCPICKNLSPQSSAAAINNVIARAIRDSGSRAELIANLWGWSPFMGWSEAQTMEGVELLDKDISVMCVSEYDLDIEKGGVKSRIIDYSIGNPGPSDITKKTLKKAADEGHKIWAKIQTNNSWECSAVPYLPVFDLVYEHVKKLSEIGVKDYMLTWTLGGYPSPMFGMISAYSENPQTFELESWYEKTFGTAAESVHKAVRLFCEGFKEYPFSIDALYYSPKTSGAANFWSLESQKNKSTMVCFAFDDYETWIKPYPIEIYLSQYEKLLKAWGGGIDELENIRETPLIGELKIYARAAYSHFKSDYLQTEFSYLKRNRELYNEELIFVLREERENTASLLSLLYKDSKVGFEASNHYYYTERNLLVKIVQIDKMLRRLKNVATPNNH